MATLFGVGSSNSVGLTGPRLLRSLKAAATVRANARDDIPPRATPDEDVASTKQRVSE
jgi:hypothetical protein